MTSTLPAARALAQRPYGGTCCPPSGGHDGTSPLPAEPEPEPCEAASALRIRAALAFGA